MAGPTIQDVLDRIDALEISLSTKILNAELQEYYDVGDDASFATADVTYLAQTFTTNKSYKVVSIDVKLYRTGTPGNAKISIQAVDEEDKPIDNDLAFAWFDGDELTTDDGGMWYKFYLPHCILETDTKYAIVLKGVSASGDNRVYWRYDNIDAAYDGGNLLISSGTLWSHQLTKDFMFKISGEITTKDTYLVVKEINSKLPEVKMG